MKITKQINQTTNIEVEGETSADLFEKIAQLQEVFAEPECGKCKSPDLKYVIRIAQDKYKYFELRCNKCKAKLTYGQSQENKGLVYPKRSEKTDDGYSYIGTNGWVKYNKETGKEE